MGRGTLLTGLSQCQLRVFRHRAYGARAMLSRAEARTVSTLAEALLPAVDAFPVGAADVDMPGRVAAYLAHLTPATRIQLRALIRTWEAGPLASRHLRPFSRL